MRSKALVIATALIILVAAAYGPSAVFGPKERATGTTIEELALEIKPENAVAIENTEKIFSELNLGENFLVRSTAETYKAARTEKAFRSY